MSSVDWPAIATGIVGVVGIVAAYLQNVGARRTASEDLKRNIDATARNLAVSISAEDRRSTQRNSGSTPSSRGATHDTR